MSFRLRFLRGTNSQRLGKLLAEGEPLWTTDTKKLWIGDGITLGGVQVTGGAGGGGSINWSDILGKPLSFPPDAHAASHGAAGTDPIVIAQSQVTGLTTALAAKIPAAEKAAANGVATLGADGKIPTAQLPALAITDTFVAASEAAMLALTAERGDVAVRTDLTKSFILTAEPASTLGNWQELLSASSAGVLSVNGQTGVVTLTLAGLGGQPLDGDLTAIAALSGTGYTKRTAADTWATASTIPWSDVSGAPSFQAADGDLTSLSALASTGYAKRTGTDTWTLSATIPWSDLTGTPTTLAGYGVSMATARLLGRTTAGAGTPEEISVGSGLTLSAGVLSASGGTAGGADTQVQYNSGGVLAGSADLAWNNTEKSLSINGTRGSGNGVFLRTRNAASDGWTGNFLRADDNVATVFVGIDGGALNTAAYGLATVARWARVEAQGSSVNGLVIGVWFQNKPIVFGINTIEAARFTGGTLASDRFDVKYTTASNSITTGAETIAGGLGVGGQATVKRLAYNTATISTTGTIAALASADGFTRLTGAAPDIQGITAPGGGAQRLTLYCQSAVTLRHEHASASAANRIASDTGADIAVAAGKTVELIYDPTSSRWRPIRY